DRRGEVYGLLVDMLASSLAEDNPGAFFVLVRGYIWFMEEPKLDDIYRDAARARADRIMSSSYDSVGAMIEHVNKTLNRLQLPEIRLGEKPRVGGLEENAEEGAS